MPFRYSDDGQLVRTEPVSQKQNEYVLATTIIWIYLLEEVSNYFSPKLWSSDSYSVSNNNDKNNSNARQERKSERKGQTIIGCLLSARNWIRSFWITFHYYCRAVAERSYPTFKERRLRGCRRAERSYSTFKVRWGNLVQDKEQRLCFAGAAVKKYPTPKVRNPSKTVGVARGHQRADTLKP